MKLNRYDMIFKFVKEELATADTLRRATVEEADDRLRIINVCIDSIVRLKDFCKATEKCFCLSVLINTILKRSLTERSTT